MGMKIVAEFDREDLVEIYHAVDYAAFDKKYEADCTSDPEDQAVLDTSAEEWASLASKIARILGWDERYV